jgi:hypothetical protein
VYNLLTAYPQTAFLQRSQNDMYEKCKGMGLNGFISRELDKNNSIREKKNHGVV